MSLSTRNEINDLSVMNEEIFEKVMIGQDLSGRQHALAGECAGDADTLADGYGGAGWGADL